MSELSLFPPGWSTTTTTTTTTGNNNHNNHNSKTSNKAIKSLNNNNNPSSSDASDGGSSTSGSSSSSGKKQMNPKVSSLLQTFGAIKVGDPFVNANAVRVERMDKGMSELLDLHNVDELRALCGGLGLLEGRHHSESKEVILSYIRDYGKGAVLEYIRTRGDYKEKAYWEVLRLVWEGTLFEYLRTKGVMIRTSVDPRKAVLRYWMSEAKVTREFVPMYIERRTRMRESLDLSEDLRDIIAPIEANEILVKAAEGRMRVEHDFRNVMLYLAAMGSLRTMERHARGYMRDEITSLRARHHHMTETTDLLKKESLELEDRHITVCEMAAQAMAVEEELCRTAMSMWSDRASDDTQVRHLLLAMLQQQLPPVATVEEVLSQYKKEMESSDDDDGEDDEEDEGSKRRGRSSSNGEQGEDPPPADLKELAKYSTDLVVEAAKSRYLHHISRLVQANDTFRTTFLEQHQELQDTHHYRERETKRADEAEARVRSLEGKYDALADYMADECGRLEIEGEGYFATVADGLVESWVQHKQLEAARKQLYRMLSSEKAETMAQAGQLLETLGLATSEEVLRYCEHDRMRKEEMEQRQREVLEVVKAAIKAKGKKGKGGKGGGRKKK